MVKPRRRSSCGRRPCQVRNERSLRPPLLRRVCRDELYAEFPKCSSDLCQCLPIDRLSGLWGAEEMARTVRIQAAENALSFNHFTQSCHHRAARLLIYQLGVIDLARGVVQYHDQVKPPLIPKTSAAS